VANADHYDIYRDDTKIGSIATSSYLDNAATEGSHAYYVKAVNSAGSASAASAPVTVVVDKTAPVITSVSWSANPLQHGQNTSLSVIATDFSAISNVTYTINNGSAQPLTYDPTTNSWKATFGSSLAVNTYAIAIIATDAAANPSSPYLDILAVYDAANGSVSGHEKLVPSANDTLPVARDTATHNPTEVTVGFTNVKAAGSAPASGSVDMQYIIKNKKDAFDFSSNTIDWLVVPDANHASVLSHGDLTIYVNSVKTVVQNAAVRIDVTLGTNGAPDHVTIKIYDPGVNPNTGTATYVIDDALANSSKTVIKN